METKKEKKPKKFLALIINELQPHVVPRRNPFMEKILGFIKTEKPFQWHSATVTADQPKNIVTLDLSQLKESVEKETGMEVRFFVKKANPTPILTSNDVMGKAQALKKKRRPLTRFWRSDTLS